MNEVATKYQRVFWSKNRMDPPCTTRITNKMVMHGMQNTGFTLQSITCSLVHSPIHISHNALYLPPKFCILALFLISLGTAVIPRRNEKQRLCKNFGGQMRSITGDVQVANKRYRIRRLMLGSTMSCHVTERHFYPFPGFAPTKGQERTLRDYAA